MGCTLLRRFRPLILIYIAFALNAAAPTTAHAVIDTSRFIIQGVYDPTGVNVAETLHGHDWSAHDRVTVTCYYPDLAGTSLCRGGGDFDKGSCAGVTPDNATIVADAAMTTPNCWFRKNFGLSGAVDAAQFGVYSDGVNNDTDNLNKALSVAAAAGYRRFRACGQTLASSADVVVPPGVTLDLCATPPDLASNHDYTLGSGLAGVLAHPSTTTVDASADGASVTGGTVMRSDGVDPPTSFVPNTVRDAINMSAAFAGTGIKAGGNSNKLQDLLILGFEICIASGGQGIHWSHVSGDCPNGMTIESTDNAQLDDITFLSFLTHGLSLNQVDIVDIFSATTGEYKVTVDLDPGAFQLVGGDIVYIGTANGGGTQSASGKWTIGCGGTGTNCSTVSGGADNCPTGHTCQEFTLTGSTCALISGTGCGPIAVTAAWSAGARVDGTMPISVLSGSLANVAVGQAVDDGGPASIPAPRFWMCGNGRVGCSWTSPRSAPAA